MFFKNYITTDLKLSASRLPNLSTLPKNSEREQSQATKEAKHILHLKTVVSFATVLLSRELTKISSSIHFDSFNWISKNTGKKSLLNCSWLSKQRKKCLFFKTFIFHPVTSYQSPRIDCFWAPFTSRYEQ